MQTLKPMLKQLRLSGIYESLEARNTQAIKEQLSYIEFLSLVFTDELARREQKRFALRLRKAGFRAHKTLEEFDFGFNPSINKAQIYDLASCRFIEESANVLIVGPCGTGKSHIAQSLGHYAIRKGVDVLFFNQSKLLSDMHTARATGNYDKKIKELIRCPLLIIDDFGLKPINPPFDEYLHEIISERYERKSTIITSNLDFSEWIKAFENQLLGAASIDRLRHNAYQVKLVGKSYRMPKKVK